MASKAKIILYTSPTPNGYKASIALEELKAAGAQIEYETHPINMSENEQKTEWFMKINPNGRIPAITDTTKGINIWESASLVLYLAKHYDPNHTLTFDTPEEEADMYSWIFFGHGGLGPMQGQLGHFTFASEKVPYAINRYKNETERLYGTYERHLAEGGREWLVGKGKGKFSVVDILTYPWVRFHSMVGVTLDQFPNLKAWTDRVAARPATQAGLKVPVERPIP